MCVSGECVYLFELNVVISAQLGSVFCHPASRSQSERGLAAVEVECFLFRVTHDHGVMQSCSSHVVMFSAEPHLTQSLQLFVNHFVQYDAFLAHTGYRATIQVHKYYLDTRIFSIPVPCNLFHSMTSHHIANCIFLCSQI